MANERILYINNDLRTILIPEEFVVGVVNDKLTHRITFRLPRFFHGIDLNDGYGIFVKYTNALLEDDMNMIEHEDTDVRETSIFFTWVPNRTAYMAEGPLKFNVSLVKTDDEGTVTNEFNTAAHTLRVLPGVELDNLIPEEVEKNILAQSRNILEKAYAHAEAAGISEINAKNSELNARESEINAAASEQAAKESEDIAEAWAVGTRHGVPVTENDETYENNSKYWAETSQDRAESWARGTMHGVPVPENHETHNNNAMYWAEVSRYKTVFGERTLQDAMNYVYPVGSIYMTTSTMNPNVIFGGTWERIKSKFLFAAEDEGDYVEGQTGGAIDHILTTSELPSHTHTFTGQSVTSGGPSKSSTGGPSTDTSGPPSPNITSGEPQSVNGVLPKLYTGDSGTLYTDYVDVKIEEYNGNTGSPDSYNTSTAGAHTHKISSEVLYNRSNNVALQYGTNAKMDSHAGPSTDSAGAHSHSFNHRHSMKHTHTLTNGNHRHSVPSHKHEIPYHAHSLKQHTHSLNSHTHSMQSHTHSVTAKGTNSNTGNGLAHNNMPPYLCVYMWKRTALAPLSLG